MYLCERISKQLKLKERKLNKNNVAVKKDVLTLESAVKCSKVQYLSAHDGNSSWTAGPKCRYCIPSHPNTASCPRSSDSSHITITDTSFITKAYYMHNSITKTLNRMLMIFTMREVPHNCFSWCFHMFTARLVCSLLTFRCIHIL